MTSGQPGASNVALDEPSRGSRRHHRLAFVTSHPIQYQAPLFRELASRPELDLTVFFCSDHGVRETLDLGFGATFKWDTPLLEGYRFEFVPNRSPLPGVGNGFWGEVNPGLLGRLRAERFDAVLIHGYAYASCWIAMLGALLSGSRLMLRMESNLLDRRGPIKRVIKQLLLRPTMSLFDGCLPIGSLNYEYYRRYGVSPEKMVYAPYTVDNSFFQRNARVAFKKRAAIRADLGLAAKGPVALFCAKLIKKKRPLDFLEALSRTRTPLQGLVVGDGILRSECEAFAARHLPGRVAFAGFRNQRSIPDCFSASDVLVLCSDSEPWGLVVNEAMAADLPAIVSSSVGCAPDLIRHGQNGYVYRSGDVQALATYMDAAVTPECSNRFRELAAKRIDQWTLGGTVDGILRALRQLRA